MTKDEKKLYKLLKGNPRKPGEPIDIPKLIEIAEKLERLEKETSPYCTCSCH